MARVMSGKQPKKKPAKNTSGPKPRGVMAKQKAKTATAKKAMNKAGKEVLRKARNLRQDADTVRASIKAGKKHGLSTSKDEKLLKSIQSAQKKAGDVKGAKSNRVYLDGKKKKK